MELHIYIHADEALELILRQLEIIKIQGVTIMGKLDDIKANLAEIGNDLTEIDSDIETIQAKLAASNPTDGLTADETAEVSELVAALRTRTRATADKVPTAATP